MEVIEVKGSTFERGYQHGKAFADKVQKCCRYYFAAANVDVNDNKVSEKLDGIERNLGRFAPGLLDELSGISAGSGIPFREILLLNSATSFGAIEDLARCTNVIIADTPHGVLHAYNMDHLPEVAASFAVGEVVTLDNGTRISRLVWPGTIWTVSGINSFGLTQGMSGIWTTDTNWTDGIPSQIVVRFVLEQCTSVDEAIAMLEGLTTIREGFCLAFADSTGNAAILEISPTRQSVRELSGKALFCTNFFVSESMQNVLDTSKVELVSNARSRFKNLERLTREEGVSWDLYGLQQIMRYHAPQGSICQHGGAGDLEGFQSYSFLMIPADRRMLVTDGPPCQFPYIPLGSWLL